jgi:hypothetical protein
VFISYFIIFLSFPGFAPVMLPFRAAQYINHSKAPKSPRLFRGFSDNSAESAMCPKHPRDIWQGMYRER